MLGSPSRSQIYILSLYTETHRVFDSYGISTTNLILTLRNCGLNKRMHFTDFRFESHKNLSSTSHGNKNTIYTFMRTPEENRPKLEADLTISIAHFDTTLESALKCYVSLYLGRNKDYRELAKPITG